LELQDFDQVFIKLFEDDEQNGWSLIAGDFVLQRPKSHFLTYLKKTKGLSFDTPFPMAKNVNSRVGASVAISKGKFARNVIQGIEGVQGPYRLRGNDTGSIIIVLSGTERVFIDGQLLVRGQENDYVIDYNTAEVTFTHALDHQGSPHHRGVPVLGQELRALLGAPGPHREWAERAPCASTSTASRTTATNHCNNS
jgi:hypothetical protein